MSFGQGIPFDRIFEMIREQMRKAGLDLTEEQFQQAFEEFERFSRQLGDVPRSGIFSTKIEIGPDGVPKFHFNFGSTGDPSVHINSEGYIEPAVEIMNYSDTTLVIAELPDAEEDSLQIIQDGEKIEIYAVSSFGEFRKIIDMSQLKRKKLKTHSFKNGILEISFK